MNKTITEHFKSSFFIQTPRIKVALNPNFLNMTINSEKFWL